MSVADPAILRRFSQHLPPARVWELQFMPELPLKDELIPLLLEVLSGIITVRVNFKVSLLRLDLG
jgi:hypothetical protein